MPGSKKKPTSWAIKRPGTNSGNTAGARVKSVGHAKWWWITALVSAVLIAVLVSQWQQMDAFRVQHAQLVNEQAVNDYLQSGWQQRIREMDDRIEPIRQVRTGIFIQSLDFSDSNEVSVNGYIWQKYFDPIDRDIKPGRDQVGFVLPDQVGSGSDTNTREAYRIQFVEDGVRGEVIGWYFDTTLRQPFDYSDYPFDHTKVWVRMWHREFWRNIVLVPDFKAYTDMDELGEYRKNCIEETQLAHAPGPSCTFGINEDIVLGTWVREDTYFDYAEAKYDNNFGIDAYVGQYGFPELRYNFVLKRKFENAFIVYLLPLLLVAMLLFAALLTVSNRENLADRFGFNTSGFIGACSALFFVVLLAHVQLREQFAGTPIVYIEYFYILMYVLLVLATANVFLFTIRPRRGCGWILYQDNIIFKMAFWPVVLACLILITLGVS